MNLDPHRLLVLTAGRLTCMSTGNDGSYALYDSFHYAASGRTPVLGPEYTALHLHLAVQ